MDDWEKNAKYVLKKLDDICESIGSIDMELRDLNIKFEKHKTESDTRTGIIAAVISLIVAAIGIAVKFL